MSIDKPDVSFSIIPAQQIAGVTEQRVLITGQMLPAGSAVAGDLIRDFPNDGSEDTLFGATSHIAGLVRAFKELNIVSNLDVIPLDDSGTAVDGTGVITFGTGPAGADTVITVTICSEQKFKVSISVIPRYCITGIIFPSINLPFAETESFMIGAIPFGPFKLNLP